MKQSIRIGMFVLMGLALTAVTSAAETRYVTDDLTITLRTGPAKDRKIIAFPKSGTPLQVIDAGDEYTEVQTRDGKQGFVLTRFLTAQVPADIRLAQLEKEHATIVKRYEALRDKAATLNTETKGLSGDLSSAQKSLEKVTAEYEALKRDSKDFLKLKAKYDKAVKDAAEARARADKVDKELSQLYSSQLNTGLLYGGGLIVVGFFAGFILKRPKRKSPLL
jgi:SH3 domain protein